MSYIFAAFRRAHFSLNARLKSATGLHSSEYEVLRYIGEHPGAIQAHIAEATGVDTNTVGSITARFRRRRWIEIGDTENLRSLPFFLTPDGEAARSDARVAAMAIEQALIRITGKPIEKLTREIERISELDDVLARSRIEDAA